MLRLGGGDLQQRSDVFVWLQGRGGQVPGPPVGLAVQGGGEPAVRRGALGEGHAVVDRRPGQRMGEAQPGLVDLDQAQPLGRGEGPGIGPGNSRDRRAQVRAVGHRGQQQRGLRFLGQGGEPGGEHRAQPVGGGQRLGGPPAAGSGIVGDHRGQLDQRHRIPRGLGEHLRPRQAAGRARLPIQQPAGVRRGQRPQVQLGESPVKAGRRDLPPRGHQQHHAFGIQPARGEGQGVQRTAIQPVRVVGDHQNRGPLGQVREQGQYGDPGQERVGGDGVRSEAERPQQGLGLPAREGRRRWTAPAAAADAARRTRVWTPTPGR